VGGRTICALLIHSSFEEFQMVFATKSFYWKRFIMQSFDVRITALFSLFDRGILW